MKAVIGHLSRARAPQILPPRSHQKAGIVQISPASTNPRFTDEGGWNVIRLVPRDDAQADAAAALVLAHSPAARSRVVD